EQHSPSPASCRAEVCGATARSAAALAAEPPALSPRPGARGELGLGRFPAPGPPPQLSGAGSSQRTGTAPGPPARGGRDAGSGAGQEAQPPPEGANGLERGRRGACPPPAAAYHPQQQPGGRRRRPAPHGSARPGPVRSGPVRSGPQHGPAALGPFPAAPEGLADLPAPACPGVHGLSQADSRALEVQSLTDPEKAAEAWDVFFKSVWGMPATDPESPMCR
ncbi:hypothetical protein Nmel_017313, partial [Mimus melanotis]